ncbi:MAG: MFS transporter [Anaerolineae bacterium]|nr:MFS transporter [Anaerolineae bacterium]
MRSTSRLLLNRLVGLYEVARGRGPYDVQERNVALLYLDIAAASVMAAAANFNGALALRLGASNALIGLMTSLPALITMIGMIPASVIVERQTRRWPMMLRSLLITRVLFFLIVLIPLVVPAPYQAAAFVALLTIRFVPVLIFSAGFDSALADMIAPRLRAQVFSWRNILATAATILALLLIRPWLELAPFPLNYQVVYMMGGLAGLVSYWFLIRMQVPDSVPHLPAERGRRLNLEMVRETLAGNRAYVRFLVNSLAGNAGAYLASPLYIIYYVRTLNASDGWIASATLAANLAAMVGFFVWRRLLPRLGEDKTLRATWPITGLYPLLIGISGSLNTVILVILWYGVISPGLNLSHYNTLLEVCPQARRPTYISVYSALNNALAFALPMLAVALANRFGLTPVLALASLLWIAGGVLFSVNPVGVPDVSRQGAER